MGLVMMSERELNRVEVLSQVSDGRCSTAEAANLLNMSQRQIQRMMLRYRDGGVVSIRHKARGRPPNNQKSNGVREYALLLIRENYPDFGPTLVTEKLCKSRRQSGPQKRSEIVICWMSFKSDPVMSPRFAPPLFMPFAS